MMSNIFQRSLLERAENERKLSYLTQGSILADQLSGSIVNIDKENIYEFIRGKAVEASLRMDGRILILDTYKRVWIDSNGILAGEYLDELKEVDEALQGGSEANIYYLEDQGHLLYAAVPILDNSIQVNGVIIISADVESSFEDINSTMDIVMYFSVIGLLATTIVSFILSNVLTRPLNRLTQGVRSITMGNYDERIEVHGQDEISNLSTAFNLMSARLHQVDDQRARFVSNVSHELRTPLASLKIISESLLAQKENLPMDLVIEFLQDIDSEADRLNKIIDSLLYLVNIEKEELKLELTNSMINRVTSATIRRIKPLADQKQISLHYLEKDKIYVDYDYDKIKQMLINIVGNAVKYTPEGGEVFVTLEPLEQSKIKITVQDTGIGIPEEDIPYIFDRFYRVDHARARQTGGTGLGLSIAKQIVNLHQGDIMVTSTMGQGTTFIIILPRKLEV